MSPCHSEFAFPIPGRTTTHTVMPLIKMRTFRDQMGTIVTCASPPERIISLVPSQTELLASLGLDENVVGITKFCVHPDSWRQTKTKVGGTKQFDFSCIDSLEPDLIIGNKEENYLEGIETLKAKYPVWMSDISTLNDALDMIRELGDITGKLDQAGKLITEIETSFPGRVYNQRVLYLIWKNPWMAAGRDTFIHDMISRIGFDNVVLHDRYPELSEDQIRSLEPELVFLSSEPYPFRERHIAEVRRFLPRAQVLTVDGEMFSWYGSRLKYAPDYFRSLPLQRHNS